MNTRHGMKEFCDFKNINPESSIIEHFVWAADLKDSTSADSLPSIYFAVSHAVFCFQQP